MRESYVEGTTSSGGLPPYVSNRLVDLMIGDVESDCDTALLARGVCSRTLMPRDCQQEFAPMSTALPVRKELPVQEDWGYIRPGAGSVSPFRDRPVTGSHLFWSDVCCALGLWTPHLLIGLWPWTLVCHFRLSCDQCWWCTMPPGQTCLWWTRPRWPRRPRPDAAVIKVMLIPDNSCIRVVIPDDHYPNEFHEILIHDMEEEEPSFVALSDLSCLRLDWSRALFTFMGRYQLDLEHLRRECRERFGSTQSGLCTFCGKNIQQNLGRHVACYNMDLAQLWQ